MSSTDCDATFVAVRAALLASYSGALASTRLTPLAALEYIAAALGSIYREVADCHLDPNGCPCGWQPSDILDLAALERALATNALRDKDEAFFDLRSAMVVGHG